MISINIHEAKTQLSKYLAKLRPGESILICKRNVPIAELRALPRQGGKPRPIGLAKAEFSVPESFFEPLPDTVINEFEGEPV
ncbi:MAG: type II toxin-antitoxin system Phd/YefM family antitoxin [Burkholderiales bacterium]